MDSSMVVLAVVNVPVLLESDDEFFLIRIFPGGVPSVLVPLLCRRRSSSGVDTVKEVDVILQKVFQSLSLKAPGIVLQTT